MWFIFYTLIFLLIGILAFLPFGRIKIKELNWWLFVLWGIISFELTLIIQPPIQQWWAMSFASSSSALWYKYIVVFLPLALISGILQETLKSLPFMIRKSPVFNKESFKKLSWRGLALAIGIGFGVWEAIRLVAYNLSYLTAFLALPVFERILAIFFHVASTAFVVYGLKKGRILLYLIIASLAHGMFNYPAVLYSSGSISIGVVYAICTIITVSFWGITLYLWRGIKKNEK